MGQRLLRSRERELAVAPDVTGGLAVHVVLGIEALDFARDLGVEEGGVEARDPADAGDAFDHVRPDGFEIISERCDKAHAGDGHTTPVVVGCHVPSIGTPGPNDSPAEWQNGGDSLDLWSKARLKQLLQVER